MESSIFDPPLPEEKFKLYQYSTDTGFNLLMKLIVAYRTEIELRPQIKEKIEELCQSKYHLEHRTTNHKWTPLMVAQLHPSIEIITLLLNSGANVEDKDKDGLTPLIIACYYYNVEVIKLLLDSGANLNSTTKYGWKSIFYLAERGSVEAMKLLIEYGANIKEKNINGFSLLHIACQHSNLGIARFLLDSNINVDDQTSKNWTPLMYACENGNLELIRLLLDRGANINARNNEGRTSLIIASCNPETVELLIEGGANINAQDRDGNTSLHLVANKEKDARAVEIIRLLKNGGANVNILCNRGISPFLRAVDKNSFEVCQALINAGADISYRTIDGISALSIATFGKYFDIISMLLDSGATYDLNFDRKVLEKFLNESEEIKYIQKMECIQKIAAQKLNLDWLNITMMPNEVRKVLLQYVCDQPIIARKLIGIDSELFIYSNQCFFNLEMQRSYRNRFKRIISRIPVQRNKIRYSPDNLGASIVQLSFQIPNGLELSDISRSIIDYLGIIDVSDGIEKIKLYVSKM